MSSRKNPGSTALSDESPRLRDSLARIGITAPEVIELFDYLEDMPLWMKDAEGTYQWVNVSFLLNFGIESRKKVIGHNDYDLCSEALANQYRLDDERVLKGQRILSRLELIGRFDHTARWCLTTKIPLHDGENNVVGNVGITRPLNTEGPGSKNDYPLNEAIRYVSQHYKQSITNADLAATCSLSVRAFERQFRANYERTPHEYIRHIRVRMSCSPLVYTKKPIAVVASEFGFADQSHFGKEFRRIMGETPRDYRIRYQQ